MSVECGNNARTDGGHELVGEHVYILLTIGVFGLFMHTDVRATDSLLAHRRLA
jgi:hypothetical protein